MKPSLTARPIRRPLLTGLALLCGFPLGFLTVRQWKEIPSVNESGISGSPTVPAAQSPQAPSPSSADGSMRQLYEDIAAGKPIEWKSTLEAAHAGGDIPLCSILIAFWTDVDPFAAREWAEQKERYIHFYTPMTNAIADAWAHKDPIAAMQGFVSTNYEVPLPVWRIFNIAADKDMEMAKQLVARFPGFFEDFSAGVPRDFSQASATMAAMPPGPKRAKCIVSLLQEWNSAGGADAAVTWWRSEAAAPLRAELTNDPSLLFGHGSFLLPSLSPAELESAKSRVPSDPDFQRAVHQREAENLLATDPAAAAALASETLTGEARSIIFQKAIFVARKIDPAAARQIILSMPSGSERDALLESLAK